MKIQDLFQTGHGVSHDLNKIDNDVRDRKPNFVVSVVYRTLTVGGCVVLVESRKSYLGTAEITYMCDGPIETVECISVNIWCMLDWIWSLNFRYTLVLHTSSQYIIHLQSADSRDQDRTCVII